MGQREPEPTFEEWQRSVDRIENRSCGCRVSFPWSKRNRESCVTVTPCNEHSPMGMVELNYFPPHDWAWRVRAEGMNIPSWFRGPRFHDEVGQEATVRAAFTILRDRIEHVGGGGWVELTDPDGRQVERIDLAPRPMT